MHSIEVSESADRTKPRCCSWLTIPRGVGFLALVSLLLGMMILSYSVMDLVSLSQNRLNAVRREKFYATIEQRVKAQKADKIKKKSSSVWYGAAGAGLASGIIQSVSSLWFIYHSFRVEEQEKLGFKANMWIFFQLTVVLMLMTIFGAIFIAGFQPDDMIRVFGIDFILLNVFVLFGVILIRRDIGQLGIDEPRDKDGKGQIAAHSVLLVY